MPLFKQKIRHAQDLADQTAKLNQAIDKLSADTGTIKLTKQTKELKENLVNAEIEHKRQHEEWEKEKREVTHMVGLQKQRGEQELELAKKAADQERIAAVKEAELAVREGNLDKERQMMKEQIDNLSADLRDQIAYLKNEVLDTVIKAVPNFNVDMVLDPHGSRDAAAQRKALARGKGNG